VRNPTKAKSYVEQLYKDVPTYRGEVKTLALDLTSFASVRSFVKELDAAVPRLDFALLNAGVINMEHVETEDGWLADIQVNVLSTGLLALLLLPKLNATAKLPQPTGGEPADLKPQLHIVASEGELTLLPLALSSVSPFFGAATDRNGSLYVKSALLGPSGDAEAHDRRRQPPQDRLLARVPLQDPVR